MGTRISDSYPINVIPKNDEEKYVIKEAKLWLNDNMFKSNLGFDEHVNNVVALGRKITPFIIEMMRENNTESGMYSHFLLAVITKLYEGEIRFEGYCPPSWCMKTLIELYNTGGFELIDKAIDERNDGI